MTKKNIYLAFSYDTEHPVPGVLPPSVITREEYSRLAKGEKKEAWTNFLTKDIWSDPEFIPMSLAELEMIEKLSDLFRSFSGEFTSFILGKWLDAMVEALGQERVRKFFKGVKDIQSHSYEHRIFFSTGDPARDQLSPPLSPQEFDLQLQKSSSSIAKHLNVIPWGLRSPQGNTIPIPNEEIIKIISRNGFRFISTWLKKAPTEPNSPLELQPFFYENSGHRVLEAPGVSVLEIPGVGFYDVHFTQPTRLLVFDDEKDFPPEEMSRYYIGLIESCLRSAGEKPIFIPLVFHPSVATLYDPDLKVHREILEFCKKEGVQVVSYAAINSMMRRQ